MKAEFKSFPLMSMFLAMVAMAWPPWPLECNDCEKKAAEGLFFYSGKTGPTRQRQITLRQVDQKIF
jgi:hypothetical protein